MSTKFVTFHLSLKRKHSGAPTGTRIHSLPLSPLWTGTTLRDMGLDGEEDIYRTFFHLSAEGIWRVDLDHPIDISLPPEAQIEQFARDAYFGECNQAFAVACDYPKPEDMRGLRLNEYLDMTHPENLEFLLMFIRSGYRLINIETYDINDDGQISWFLDNFYGIIQGGKLTHAWGSRQDITARKQNENIQSALYKMSQATYATQNLPQLYRSIHEILGELMPAHNFFISEYDPINDLLHFPYFVDEVDSAPEPKKPGRGLTEYVLRTGKPLLAGPAEFDRLVAAGEVETIGAPSIDWLGVPLIVNNVTIGVLALQTYTEGVRYGEVEKDILMFVSTQVAMAIDRKRSEETLRINEARFRAIVEDQTEMISRFRPGDYILTFVNDAYCRYFGKTSEELLGTSFLPLVPPEHQPILMSMLASLTPQNPVITSENRGIRVEGSTSWEQWSNRAIFDENGRLIEYQTVGRDITDRKRAEDELRYLSTHDRLTGIYNRAYFEEEMSRLERGRFFPVSVIIADVDGLKDANDSYGHWMGDEILRLAADGLKNAFRAQDVVARIGGDEFGVLLPSTDAEVTKARLDSVRHNLDLYNTRRDVPIRLSMGFATAERGSDLADAYKQADTMMYQEKFQVRARRVRETLIGIKRDLTSSNPGGGNDG